MTADTATSADAPADPLISALTARARAAVHGTPATCPCASTPLAVRPDAAAVRASGACSRMPSTSAGGAGTAPDPGVAEP
ncbi:hypothetical protein AB0A67_39875, partial [Streptomyces eurythermus]